MVRSSVFLSFLYFQPHECVEMLFKDTRDKKKKKKKKKRNKNSQNKNCGGLI